MARDIDEADLAQMRESEVDGDAAALFFFQTISINPCECPYQRSLTVIDVSGRADDERNSSILLLKGYMGARISASEWDLLDELIEDVINAAEEVAATLGGRFQRDVYECALARELVLRGRSVDAHATCSVLYKGARVGGYSADLIVAGRLAVGVECVRERSLDRAAQCRDYLKVSGMPIGLMIRIEGTEVHWEPVVNPEVHSFAA